jgi:protein-S-isoprenylcysteine O-methyltransferase Ste14
MRVTWIRLVVAAVGLFVWSYGYRADDPAIRWVGIAMLAVALLLRFWARRRMPPS